MPEIIEKIIIHIEDEFTDWQSLIISIEAEIMEDLESDDDYNSFEITLPKDRRTSPTTTILKWTKNDQKYVLRWVGNKSAKLEKKLIDSPYFKKIKLGNMFFIIDCLRPKESGEGLDISLDDSFESINDHVIDTYKQVRIFTAYKQKLLQGVWDVKLPLKTMNGDNKQMAVRNHSGLIINKAQTYTSIKDHGGLILNKAGTRTPSNQPLEDFLMEFIYE